MRTDYSFDDLLAEHPYERPLVLDGVPCHGGFVGGRYVSPRTLRRAGAIEAWQARLPAGELAAVLDPISARVPPHFPSVGQTKLLVRHGVTVPLVRILSIIAIVEGFGGEVLRGFSLAMIWGILIGTYSTIFVASPMLIYMHLRRDREAKPAVGPEGAAGAGGVRR